MISKNGENMSQHIKKLMMNPWTVGLGVLIIGTPLTACIQASIQNIKIIDILKKWFHGMKLFLSSNISLWKIFIGIIVVLIIFYIRKKLTKKPVKWLKKMLTSGEENISRYFFLLWYPINGTRNCGDLNLNPSERLKLMNSNVIRNLLKQKILRVMFDGTYEISEDAYEFLEKELYSEKDKNTLKDVINLVQSHEFRDLIWNSACRKFEVD
jgi:hypothetical protein